MNASLLIWVKVFSTIMAKKLSSLANEYLQRLDERMNFYKTNCYKKS